MFNHLPQGHAAANGWPSMARVQHAPTGASVMQERRREKILCG